MNGKMSKNTPLHYFRVLSDINRHPEVPQITKSKKWGQITLN